MLFVAADEEHIARVDFVLLPVDYVMTFSRNEMRYLGHDMHIVVGTGALTCAIAGKLDKAEHIVLSTVGFERIQQSHGLEIVIYIYGYVLLAGFDDSRANAYCGSAFLTAELGLTVFDDAVAELGDLSAYVVVVNIDGQTDFNFLGGLAHIVLNAVVVYGVLEQAQEVGGIVNDDGAFCAVEAGAHGVVALAADGAEDLSLYVVGHVHQSDGSIVGRPMLENLAVGIAEYLSGVAAQPSEKVNCMAAAADETVAR